MDKTAAIYEEQKRYQKDKDDQNKKESTEWSLRYKFQDAKESIEDIKFAPRHPANGGQLTIGVASKDGFVRIYRTEKDTNMAQWVSDS